jgi:hypothetical protein
VACEAYFSDAGALQLVIDQHALFNVFKRYTERPGSYFRELQDAVKLLNLDHAQAEFVRQVRGWKGPDRMRLVWKNEGSA